MALDPAQTATQDAFEMFVVGVLSPCHKRVPERCSWLDWPTDAHSTSQQRSRGLAQAVVDSG
ncbi:hypothetical protein GCM10009837_66960 [Streptomyces durmitorensis]